MTRAQHTYGSSATDAAAAPGVALLKGAVLPGPLRLQLRQKQHRPQVQAGHLLDVPFRCVGGGGGGQGGHLAP